MTFKFLKIILISFFFNSCVSTSYKLEANDNREPILNNEFYTFNQKFSDQDFKIIDTTSYYIETFEGLDSNEEQRANPSIYKFHNDGYYKEDSYLYFGKFDKERKKNSAYYGGKYAINGNIIKMESFYPSSGSRTKKFIKEISKGVIKNDTIVIDFFGTTHKYVKKKYSQIFN